jgi:hypothetical protein
MPVKEEKRRVLVVTACTRSDGLPDFALTEIAVTEAESENGTHYQLAEAALTQRGYEAPFVHFDEDISPLFLFPAVKEYLGLTGPVSP